MWHVKCKEQTMDSSVSCLHVLVQQMIYSPRAMRGKTAFPLTAFLKGKISAF